MCAMYILTIKIIIFISREPRANDCSRLKPYTKIEVKKSEFYVGEYFFTWNHSIFAIYNIYIFIAIVIIINSMYIST